MTTRRHVGTIPGVPARRCVSREGPESNQSCLKRFADMVSAFENGRAGQDRPQWAPSSRDLGWPRAACLLWGAHCEKADVDGAQCFGSY